MSSTEPQMTPARAAAIRSMLVQHVQEEPALARARRRVRWIWAGLGGLAVCGAAAVGATAVQEARTVSNELNVHCASSSSPNQDGTFPGSAATIATDDERGRVTDAKTLCTQMWEGGVLEQSVDPKAPVLSPGEAPADLQVCVMRDGSAAVVPSSNPGICPNLGLASLTD